MKTQKIQETIIKMMIKLLAEGGAMKPYDVENMLVQLKKGEIINHDRRIHFLQETPCRTKVFNDKYGNR